MSEARELKCNDKEESGKLLEEESADFETALAATGFGKFSIFLLILTIPTSWTAFFQTTTMSVVFPAAQCDLDLSLEDKGLLNAVTYGGTILSSFLWGFLFDTIGRRKLLTVLYFADFLCVILSGFAQNKEMLLIIKFIGGFIVSGPYNGITTYLSEINNTKFRSRLPLILGIGFSSGCIMLPLLGALILPLNIKFIISENLVIRSWSVFLFICSLPSLLCWICFIFLPESPKFLMSIGRNQEALKVFQKMYTLNTNKPSETYTVKKLVEETNIRQETNKTKSSFENFKNSWKQVRSLFSGQQLRIFLLVSAINIFSVSSLTTLMLWMPQLFQAINDYQFLNNDTSTNLCEMLDVIRPSPNETITCSFNPDNSEVYLNSAGVGLLSLSSFLIASVIVDKIGHKKLLGVLSFGAGCAAVCLYLAPNGYFVPFLISIYKTMECIATNVILIIIVNLFPTTLRAMALSLSNSFATGFSMVSNIVFPYLIKIGCAPPFIAIAMLNFVCSFLSLFLPKERKTLI